MKREPAFLATVYHDEPEDAATDSSAEFFPAFADAEAWAKRTMSVTGYWNGWPSTIHSGFIVTPKVGLARWEDSDEATCWLVYGDHTEKDG